VAVLLSRKWPSGAPHGSSHPGANPEVTRREMGGKIGSIK